LLNGNLYPKTNTHESKNFRYSSVFLSAITLFGQTKKNGYKSHSGHYLNYSASLNNKIFDSESSNFGLGPELQYFLDSGILISDTSFILYRRIEELPSVDSISTFYISNDEYNHTINVDMKNIDSIKTIILKTYVFDQELDSVKFIDQKTSTPNTMENEQTQKKKEKRQDLFPVIPVNNNDNDNAGMPLTFIVSLLFFVSVLPGIFVSNLAKKEHNGAIKYVFNYNRMSGSVGSNSFTCA